MDEINNSTNYTVSYPSEEELDRVEAEVLKKYRDIFTRLARRDRYGKPQDESSYTITR